MMPSLLSCNSTANFKVTFGRTSWARSTTSCRAKEASRVILSCQPCSPLIIMKPSKQSPGGLLPSEKLFAFLDDIFIVAAPERLAILHRQVETALWDHARIRINQGKTPDVESCRCIPRWLRAHCGGREECKSTGGGVGGDQSLPTSEQGIRVLGTPFGHCHHVQAEVRITNEEHSTLLCRILALQCAWLLLLFCAPARANYLLRVLPPSQSESRQCTIPRCGIAFASCWTSAHHRCWTEPGCLWPTEGWVCGAQ